MSDSAFQISPLSKYIPSPMVRLAIGEDEDGGDAVFLYLVAPNGFQDPILYSNNYDSERELLYWVDEFVRPFCEAAGFFLDDSCLKDEE